MSFFFCENSDSLSLIFCIQIASVIARLKRASVITGLMLILTRSVFNVCEPVFDGVKFRLEQPLKLFGIGDVQNGIWKNLEAVVNLSYSLAFSLHEITKTFMCAS
jgi:hypothetical protein